MLKSVCFAEPFALFRTPRFEWRKWDDGFRVRVGYGNENSQCRFPRLLNPSPGFCWFEFLSGYGSLLAFFCAVLSCLDECLALRRRKWPCPNLEFFVPRTSHFTLQIQVYSFDNRIWIKLMDCWWYYVKLSCVTCGIMYSLSLLITPILKVKIK